MSGIDPDHLRYNLIRPILKKYDLWSEAAENLLIMTAAQESKGGYWLVQLNNGPARGIYQMEPLTYHEVRTIVAPNPKIRLDFDIPVDYNCLVWDLRLTTITCRLQYWRFTEPLPNALDTLALAKYYKKYYNSVLGKAIESEIVKNYINYTE